MIDLAPMLTCDGRMEEARPLLEQALINLQNAQAYFQRGVLLEKSRDPKAALENFREAINWDRKLVGWERMSSARLGLAHVYFQNSEDDKSVEQLQYALKSDLSNADGHFLWGEILVRRHHTDGAILYLKIIVEALAFMLLAFAAGQARCGLPGIRSGARGMETCSLRKHHRKFSLPTLPALPEFGESVIGAGGTAEV